MFITTYYLWNGFLSSCFYWLSLCSGPHFFLEIPHVLISVTPTKAVPLLLVEFQGDPLSSPDKEHGSPAAEHLLCTGTWKLTMGQALWEKQNERLIVPPHAAYNVEESTYAWGRDSLTLWQVCGSKYLFCGGSKRLCNSHFNQHFHNQTYFLLKRTGGIKAEIIPANSVKYTYRQTFENKKFYVQIFKALKLFK